MKLTLTSEQKYEVTEPMTVRVADGGYIDLLSGAIITFDSMDKTFEASRPYKFRYQHGAGIWLREDQCNTLKPLV